MAYQNNPCNLRNHFRHIIIPRNVYELCILTLKLIPWSRKARNPGDQVEAAFQRAIPDWFNGLPGYESFFNSGHVGSRSRV